MHAPSIGYVSTDLIQIFVSCGLSHELRVGDVQAL